MRTPLEIAEAFSSTDSFNSESPFYLVGIGGAGMSSLAFMLKRRGCQVRGSDSTDSSTLEQLRAAGIEVELGHENTKVDPKDQIVLSDAIVLSESPEVEQAKVFGCTLFRRSQLLGWLLREKRVIAVTGTHGKTTTTSMIGSGLRNAGLDPTIIVGAFVPEFGTSVIEGHSEWAVVEACEAYDSFHDLHPEIVVLTNLELDHVDFHGSWENLKSSVARFVDGLPPEGCLIYCQDDPGAAEIAESSKSKRIGYSIEDAKGLTLNSPGDHNRRNAAGALHAIANVGADQVAARAAIEAFRGADRRLQVILDEEIALVDDYAHHPTEISASISALRERFPGRRLCVVFQPHLYSRTAGLIREFAVSLSEADWVVMTDIYPAREEPMPGISSARIVELVTVPCRYVPSRHLLASEVVNLVRQGDVVVGMGAGNISEFVGEFERVYRRRRLLESPDRPKLDVVVVLGGDSAEREVSLHSGRAIRDALVSRGHTARLVDASELLLSSGSVQNLIGKNRPDVAFLAVHGTNAEDGAIQGLFELLHIPYTGSGIQASAIAMDKALTKTTLERFGVSTPGGLIVSAHEILELAVQRVSNMPWAHRCIVKPNAQGSTVGLSFVESEEMLLDAIRKAQVYGDVLVEEWVEGMEVSTPVLGDRALSPVEICPDSGRYDFESKYVPGATLEVVPARLSPAKLAECQAIALHCHQALGCRGATRTDMMIRDQGEGDIVVLEVNTIPGMTSTSLLPNSARSVGIEMDDLCEWMLYDAWRAHARQE